MQSPEEKAKEIVDYYWDLNDSRSDLIDDIAAALRTYGDDRATAERERCACLVDILAAKERPQVGHITGWDVGKYGAYLLDDAAAAIRALDT